MPDNEAYWEQRHTRLRGATAAVGDITKSEAENVVLYARKKRKIADVLRAIGGLDLIGLDVLDAGCGIGLVSELFYALGARVTGIDASAIAVEEAARRAPSGSFSVASLIDFELSRRFDIVYCGDVLYHVVHDENWSQAVGNLARHVGDHGHLLILDQLKYEPQNPAQHVRFRTKAMYDAVVGECGLVDVTKADQRVFIIYRRP